MSIPKLHMCKVGSVCNNLHTVEHVLAGLAWKDGETILQKIGQWTMDHAKQFKAPLVDEFKPSLFLEIITQRISHAFHTSVGISSVAMH